MNLFEAVKDSVTTRQAAESYGLQVKHGGMCRCPFHNDKTPSMKVDKRFHCFGCQADGDVIDFTARLFGLTPKDAAESWRATLASPTKRERRSAPSQSTGKSRMKKSSGIRWDTAIRRWRITEISLCNGSSCMSHKVPLTILIPGSWRR